MERLKKRLEQILFPELYFHSTRRYHRLRPVDPTFLRSFIGLLVTPLLTLGVFGFYFTGYCCYVTAVVASEYFNYNDTQLEYLLAMPMSLRDFVLGRFLWSVCLSLFVTILYVPMFFLLQQLYVEQWGLSEPLLFSQVLAFGLMQLSALILVFAITVLIRSSLSQRTFQFILIPLFLIYVAVWFWDLTHDSFQPVWQVSVTLPVGLLSIPVSVGLAGVCYWGAVKILERR